MAAQKGRDFLLKIRTTVSPEAFTTVAGLRSNTLTINDETVDVTDKGSNGYRELLSGRIVQSMQVSGECIFKDETTANAIRVDMLAGDHEQYQIVVPGTTAGAAGTFEGAFRVVSMEYSGEYNGEVVYNISLESDGQIAFTDLV